MANLNQWVYIFCDSYFFAVVCLGFTHRYKGERGGFGMSSTQVSSCPPVRLDPPEGEGCFPEIEVLLAPLDPPKGEGYFPETEGLLFPTRSPKGGGLFLGNRGASFWTFPRPIFLTGWHFHTLSIHHLYTIYTLSIPYPYIIPLGNWRFICIKMYLNGAIVMGKVF